jgi:hypothetical protein
MKTDFSITRPRRQTRNGSAVMIILILLGIMVVLAAANTAALNRLRERVNIVDQRQTRRLAAYSTRALPANRQPNAK